MRYIDDTRGTFEKYMYSVALPCKEGDVVQIGVWANEARALRARSHMALVSHAQ